ncbi:hypothetical protein AAVH_11138 [Aphelenchoides avenae]|nr:hypothetical protein AAVH_11138 [Aphelenchus avenae]
MNRVLALMVLFLGILVHHSSASCCDCCCDCCCCCCDNACPAGLGQVTAAPVIPPIVTTTTTVVPGGRRRRRVSEDLEEYFATMAAKKTVTPKPLRRWNRMTNAVIATTTTEKAKSAQAFWDRHYFTTAKTNANGTAVVTMAPPKSGTIY